MVGGYRGRAPKARVNTGFGKYYPKPVSPVSFVSDTFYHVFVARIDKRFLSVKERVHGNRIGCHVYIFVVSYISSSTYVY